MDALNEELVRETLPPERVPTLLDYLDRASCADHAVSHFPSLTAASLATIWTGAYGNVSGVPGNSHHALPRDRHTVLETVRGYGSEGLSAEPLWITAARAGVPVAGQHVTQAPGVPGFPAEVSGREDEELERRRREAEEALSRPEVTVLNGYNIMLEPHRALGSDDVQWGDASTWEGIDALESVVPPRAFSWRTGAGTFHGLFFGREHGYDAVLVNREPVLEGGVEARALPAESTPVEDRELARHFSGALPVPTEQGLVHLRVRLFHLDPEGEEFLLYHPSLQIAEANAPEKQRAYEEAVRGWVGNSAFPLYGDGAFGSPMTDGGDGSAEARLLETSELVTRQFMRGAEWLWREHEPRLLLDYFPLGDEADHNLFGYLEPQWPGYDADVARRVAELRGRLWALVDRRVAHLVGLAEEAGAALFLTGDHGMRATWLEFRPNAVLREAGLLVLDEEGEVDLSRTRAVSPNGYWISVNQEIWREGIVAPEGEEAVIAAAREALEGVLDDEGRPVVVRTLTPDEAPERGLGGAAGGDLYWATAPGVRWSWRRDGPAVRPAGIWGSHGFPPDEPDMHTVFCGTGPGLPGGRFPAVPTTVVAPTVAEYVGLPVPGEAVRGSVLDAAAGRPGGTDGS